MIHDLDFKNIKPLPCRYPLKKNRAETPGMMTKAYRIEYYSEKESAWKR